MNGLQAIYYFFSRYVNPAERRVGKFFARVGEHDPPHVMEKGLVRLLRRDIAVVNLWTERRYKGYDYLSKRTRRELYSNLEEIRCDFQEFSKSHEISTEEVLEEIAAKGVDVAVLRTKREQLAHIVAIMRYLSPRGGRYVYRASSSFGRLLRNPKQEVLEGDCNQIVTLYIALFADTHGVTDLKLTLYPGHVALHFHGVDIETTNGTFAKYNKEGQYTAPIHEIVSVNLLDTTDTNFAKSTINPEVFLQAARLAYVVSSHRQLVKRNLEVAYRNAVRHCTKHRRYEQALLYARQSKDYELIEVTSRNGAIDAMKHQSFTKARNFAGNLQNKHELIRTIDHNEAVYLYNAKHYERAAQIFSRLGERKMEQNCYRGMYVREQGKLGALKTTADIKANAGVIRSMERYARQSGDADLIKHVKSLTQYL